MHLQSKCSCSYLHSCFKGETSKTNHTFSHIRRWYIAGVRMLLVLDTGRQIVVLRRLVPSRVLMGGRMSHWGFGVSMLFMNLLINWWRQVFLEEYYMIIKSLISIIDILPWLAGDRRWYRPLCSPLAPQLDGRQCLVGEGIAGENKFSPNS